MHIYICLYPTPHSIKIGKFAHMTIVNGNVNKCLKLQEYLNWTPLHACNTKLAICAVGFVFIVPLGGNTTHGIMSKQELISRYQHTNKGCLEFFLHSRDDEVMRQNALRYFALRYSR